MDTAIFVTPDARAAVHSIDDDAYPSVRAFEPDHALMSFWETKPVVTRLPNGELGSNPRRRTDASAPHALLSDRYGMLTAAELERWKL